MITEIGNVESRNWREPEEERKEEDSGGGSQVYILPMQLQGDGESELSVSKDVATRQR